MSFLFLGILFLVCILHVACSEDWEVISCRSLAAKEQSWPAASAHSSLGPCCRSHTRAFLRASQAVTGIMPCLWYRWDWWHHCETSTPLLTCHHISDENDSYLLPEDHGSFSCPDIGVWIWLGVEDPEYNWFETCLFSCNFKRGIVLGR